MPNDLTEMIKALAREQGFDLVGVAPADPPDHWSFYERWLGRGFAGEMGYLGRNLERRRDPGEIVPGAKSILCVGLVYDPPPGSDAPVGPDGAIARYARGDDYHDVMTPRLTDLLSRVQEIDGGIEGRAYVDTGPVLERDFAARAGLGWFGKNTNLIHKWMGSWFFLGELILTAELTPDAPVTDHCGTCTRCIDACPTDALPEPYVLDSTRCISYLTIELKGPIPLDLREGMGRWIYGCDICQDVCPWNEKHGRASEETAFHARPDFSRPDLREILTLDQDAFSRTFRKSPIKRTKRRGLLRNAAVALGNTGTEEDVPVLVSALQDTEPLVRRHAAWALGRIGGESARRALSEAAAQDEDTDVVAEAKAALRMIDEETPSRNPIAR